MGLEPLAPEGKTLPLGFPLLLVGSLAGGVGPESTASLPRHPSLCFFPYNLSYGRAVWLRVIHSQRAALCGVVLSVYPREEGSSGLPTLPS